METKLPDENDFHLLPLFTHPSAQSQHNAQDTLNFYFTPSELPAGEYTFRFELDPYPTGMDPTQGQFGGTTAVQAHDLSTARTLTFQESRPLRIAYMVDGSDIDAAEQSFDMLKAAYPLSADAITITLLPKSVSFTDSPGEVQETLNALAQVYNTPSIKGNFDGLVLFTANPRMTDAGATQLRLHLSLHQRIGQQAVYSRCSRQHHSAQQSQHPSDGLSRDRPRAGSRRYLRGSQLHQPLGEPDP